MSFSFTRPQLRVFSSILSNLAVFWIGSIFVTRDPFILTVDFIYVTVCVYTAIKVEELLEE